MKDNLKTLLKVKNLANGDAAMYFYGAIVCGWWEAWSAADKWPDSVRNALKDLTGQTLHIYINSPGGAVFSGMAIYSMLSRYTGRKIVHIDGIAASIASVIAMAGDEIIMPENTMLMIHRSAADVCGNSEELTHYAELLAKLDEAILSVYEKRLINAADIGRVKELFTKESYLSAGEVTALFNGVTQTAPLEMVARAKNADAIYNASLEYERLKLLNISKQEVM